MNLNWPSYKFIFIHYTKDEEKERKERKEEKERYETDWFLIYIYSMANTAPHIHIDLMNEKKEKKKHFFFYYKWFENNKSI